MPYRKCTVRYVDRDTRHEAQVEAETMYEAAVMALKQWSMDRRGHAMPRRFHTLEIEVQAPGRYRVKVERVYQWLYETRGLSKEQRERRAYLQALLAHNGH